MQNSKGFLQPGELASFLKLDRLGFVGSAITKGILKVTKIDELNKVYAERAHLQALPFIDSMFEHLGVHYQLFEKDINRLPKNGSFITISNHPLGGIDGMILIKTLLQQREDFKVIANFLLNRVEPLKPYILPVNPFENHKDAKSSLPGIKMALSHLRDGKPLGIFPAGEVSTVQPNGKIEDKAWETGAIKLIQKAKVPVVPIYFEALNSERFYRLAEYSGTLRTALLPSQITSQHKRGIVVRIGNPIPVETIQKYDNIEELSTYLREKTYFLAKGIENRIQNVKVTVPQEAIRPRIDKELLLKDIEVCKAEGKLLFSLKNFDVYIADQTIAPNIVQEIGIQREIVFREVGEGTNKSIDLDQYDEYFKHLFIFDNTTNSLVGAYRMGLGKDIYPKYGIKGFYLNELFEFDEPFHEILENSIELGRAFITKDFQRSPMSLFILWKGIVVTLLKEDAKYLVGGVSISNSYTEFSKSIIVHFMQSFYFDQELAKSVRARMEYRPNLNVKDKQLIENFTENDIKQVDKLIDEIEPQFGMKMPVLLKKYVKQNAKLVAFNIDPNFNNAIDGLMVANIDDLPKETINAALKEYQEQIQKENH